MAPTLFGAVIGPSRSGRCSMHFVAASLTEASPGVRLLAAGMTQSASNSSIFLAKLR